MTLNTTWNAGRRSRSLAVAKAAAIALIVTVAGATASAGSPADNTHPGRHITPVARFKKWIQVGKASWYGRSFQGRRTASGEAFDLNMLTCAHRTLPIGTLLRVTNLGNRRSVMVRVNDRGPVPAGLIVDLSYRAAQSLEFRDRGKVQVRLEKVDGAEAAQLNWPNLGRPGDLPAYAAIAR